MTTKIQKAIKVAGDDNKEHLGLVHVLTGDGKGKTTSAIGLAMRAIGAGLKVYMIQFLKSGNTGEIFAIRKYLPPMQIEQYGLDAIKGRQEKLGDFTKQKEKASIFTFNTDEQEREAARLGWEHAKKIINSGNYDLVVMDEINVVLDKGLISMEEVKELIKSHDNVELVFTGRDCPQEIIDMADYVNVVTKLKNPWDRGIKARKGIEY